MAYIGSGHGATIAVSENDPYNGSCSSTDVLVVGNCDSGTADTIGHKMSETAIIYHIRARVDDFDIRQLFDYCCDQLYPQPVPMNIKPTKSAPRITNHIIKQPGPMRRGNRI